jgi:predicted transcriptional regulator
VPVKKSTKLAVANRRREVAELYVQGLTQMAIADRVGVSQPTVSDDLKKIHKEWRESRIRDFDAARDLELQKLDRAESEAWEAWEKSKKPAQSAVVTGEGADQKTRKTMKNQYGDPRYLDVVLKCVAARSALLGLEAPVQVAPVMPDGKEPFRLEIEGMSHDELRVLKKLRNHPSRIIDAKVVNERNGDH